jgi:hypothetical protein
VIRGGSSESLSQVVERVEPRMCVGDWLLRRVARSPTRGAIRIGGLNLFLDSWSICSWGWSCHQVNCFLSRELVAESSVELLNSVRNSVLIVAITRERPALSLGVRVVEGLSQTNTF